jgi:tetratricopeptide (TPR) repeat protein
MRTGARALVPNHPAASYNLRKSPTKGGAADARKALGAAGIALVGQADDFGRAATRDHNAGEYRRALDTALQGLQIAPDGEGLLYVAASAADGLGMRSEAIRHFDHLARVADRNTQTCTGRCRWLMPPDCPSAPSATLPF